MNFVKAKLLQGGYHDVDSWATRKNYFLVQVNDTPVLQREIEACNRCIGRAGAGNRQRAARGEQLQSGEAVYQLAVKADMDLDHTDYQQQFFLASELEMLEGEAPIAQRQLHQVPGMRYMGLDQWQTLGTIFSCFVLIGYQRGNLLLVHPEQMLLIYGGYFQEPDPAFEKPVQVLAKLKSARSVDVYSDEPIITQLLKMGSKYRSLVEGHTHELRDSQVTLPTEQELPVWERKQAVQRKLVVHEALEPVLKSMQNQYVGSDIYYAMRNIRDQSSWNWLQLTVNGPDYLMVDPADFKKVTYLPHGKVAGVLEKGQDPWTSTSRVSVTWAKLASNLFLSGIFTASKIEKFHSAMTAACTQEFGPEELKPELLLVSGEDIKKYYHYENYMDPQQGQLWGSCMRYEECQKFFGLYTENPDQVQLLISKDRESGKIHGRGLVWTDKEGKQYMDRIYTITEVEQQRMLKWAEKQGWTNIWEGGRNNWGGKLKLELHMPYQTHYPYMDSMCYLNPEKGTLANYSTSGSVEMRSTGGDRRNSGGEVYCTVSRRMAPPSKMAKTISKEVALLAFTKELRHGGREVEGKVTTDELQGGLISTAQVVRVRATPTSAGQVTCQSNPNICFLVREQRYDLLENCSFSVLDKGFILKEGAVEMPDGTYCSPAHAERYKTLLAKRSGNKAIQKKEVTAPSYEPALA